jgi:hypothetical protein
MNTYTKKYDKEDFLKFLEKNNVNDVIISKFVELPECIIRGGNKYDIYINVTWYNVGNTHYEFEINYYSEQLIEYLFGLKVFKDVEFSINNLLCELINNNLIEGGCR